MKRFGLLKCFPSGPSFNSSGNMCLGEVRKEYRDEAVNYFRTAFGLDLDHNGYLKVENITYTVAEFY